LVILTNLAEFDDTTTDLIDEVRQAVASAIKAVTARKEAEDEPDHSADWTYLSSASREKTPEQSRANHQTNRSVFDDVDR
jgi:hypothetical protein